MREAPLQDRIAAAREKLTPAERKVAELVVADTAAIAGATVASLARAAGVSEPTVIRFCRALGLEGFNDLRLGLVRDEAGASRRVIRPLTGLSPEDAPAAVFDGAIAALEGARQALDGALMVRMALALLRSTRVEIWACGASFAAARHLEQALLGPCRGEGSSDRKSVV